MRFWSILPCVNSSHVHGVYKMSRLYWWCGGRFNYRIMTPPLLKAPSLCNANLPRLPEATLLLLCHSNLLGIILFIYHNHRSARSNLWSLEFGYLNLRRHPFLPAIGCLLHLTWFFNALGAQAIDEFYFSRTTPSSALSLSSHLSFLLTDYRIFYTRNHILTYIFMNWGIRI